jgi:LmbE family N-acetylglucosaminyl deacetylase
LAWQDVEEISDSLCEVIGSSGPTDVYLPAYQRGHPDHDATYLAGAIARDRLGDEPGRTWWIYGLYGFDESRRLRFGWLPPQTYGRSRQLGEQAELLRIKGNALRQFSSQLWPGSALDLWLRSPAGERVAPLPVHWDRLPALPSFYDEQLNFGRHGASAPAVEAAFRRVLAARVP